MNNEQISLFLDLFNTGYKNALVSVVYFNFGETRIDIMLQNVGTLRINQTFCEANDEQCPIFEVFYTIASHPNSLMKMKKIDLVCRAVRIAYNCKKYFESHPEHIVDKESDLMKRIRKNKQMVQKVYNQNQETRNRWLFVKEK